MHQDAHRYDSRLWVVQSHLKAAMEASCGLYLANPKSHQFPEVEEIDERLKRLHDDIINVRNKLR